MGNFLEENTRMNWIGIIGDIKLAAVAGGLPSLRGSAGSGSNCSPAVPPLPWAAAAYEFTACDQEADCTAALVGAHPPPPESDRCNRAAHDRHGNPGVER